MKDFFRTHNIEVTFEKVAFWGVLNSLNTWSGPYNEENTEIWEKLREDDVDNVPG